MYFSSVRHCIKGFNCTGGPVLVTDMAEVASETVMADDAVEVPPFLGVFLPLDLVETLALLLLTALAGPPR